MTAKILPPAPRLYGLDPRPTGTEAIWKARLAAVRAMRFDGVLVPELPAADLSALVAAAAAERLGVVVDLAREPTAPVADLVPRAQQALAEGVAGFLVRAVRHGDPAAWRDGVRTLRSGHAGLCLIADVLGAPLDRLAALAGSGFDAVLDSSLWWNGHDRWFVDQLPLLRAIGRPMALLAEPHAAAGRAATGGSEPQRTTVHRLQARYLRAIGFSDGLIAPMGFEQGLIGVRSAAAAAAAARSVAGAVDLQPFVTAANALKDGHPALQGSGPLRRVSAPNARIAAFLRLAGGSPAVATEAAFVLLNTDPSQTDGLAVAGLVTAAGGRFEVIDDVTPGVEPLVTAADGTLTLEPLAVRLFVARPRPEKRTVSRAVTKRLRTLLAEADARVAIEAVTPELDGGRFPVKRVVGDVLEVEADILMDGHDRLAAALMVRAPDTQAWERLPMAPLENDRWRGQVPLTRVGRYAYTIEAWFDAFGSWRVEVTKKHGAGVPIGLELEEGRRLVARTAAAGAGEAQRALGELLAELEARKDDEGFQLARLLAADTEALMAAADLRPNLSRYPVELEVVVDRTIAAFAAWYELFPRSMSDDPNRHGTFDDVIRKLPYVRDLGFDVLYFPPIHPIGQAKRKGRNNSLVAQPGDPGSPYAIGSEAGGHDALHPELGDFDDFARLVDAAHAHGLEIAIDFAIQCSPDHPWIRAHPEWFDWRPDGSLRYAENPPKKYEDISNVAFYREGAFPDLWLALRDVVAFWVERGVRIFRVDNPHTKPLPFWEWLIADIQARHPDAVFLSEAFTRPKMMKRLAKLGFTQSYSYFTWRNQKQELQDYLTELTRDEPKEHMRPNFFVNTPDINPVYLQTSGRAGFQVRAVLAGTLSTLWGMYSGFELTESRPLPGKEEYLDSEKYEIKAWDWDRPGHIRDDIRLLNLIRRENPAFWSFTNLEFHNAWNDHVMVYSKMTPALDNAVLIAVNLDPHRAQGCQFEVPLWRFGLADDASIEVEDLVTGARFVWTGKVQHLWLDPRDRPYAIWRLVAPGLVPANASSVDALRR